MNVIGIHAGHNATAALIKDNKLVCAISEEKFLNLKNASGFPINSIKYIMSTYNLSTSDVDSFAFSSQYYSDLHLVPQSFEPQTIEEAKQIRPLSNLFCLSSRRIPYFHNFHREMKCLIYKKDEKGGKKAFAEMMKQLFGTKDSQISFFHHHHSHAFSPIGFFNLNKSPDPILVITQDGFGDLLCGTIGIYESGKYRIVDRTPFPDSIATIYGALTQYMGMRINEHEYKVMGLAPYPSEKYAKILYEKKFKGLVDVKDGKISLKHKTFVPYAYSQMVFKDLLAGERFDNIAYAVQKLVEDKMVQFVLENVKKYKIGKVAFSGGLFMNVKLNQKIQQLKEVEKCYFMPSAGDECLAIGSSFAYLEGNGQHGSSEETVYLGREFTKQEIDAYFSENGIEKKYEVEKPKDPNKEIASLLGEGKIVGRFDGRGEWGARSLGNRAIVANASSLDSVEIINNAIKSRDFWMPFAPSMLDSSFPDYAIANGKSHPYYMITTYDTTPKAHVEIKAALHRKDKTMRPNVVTEQHNFGYYALLKEYKKQTGMGGFLNTSLNIHGYPLIGFVKDLFFTMDNSDLNIAQCGPYLISKR